MATSVALTVAGFTVSAATSAAAAPVSTPCEATSIPALLPSQPISINLDTTGTAVAGAANTITLKATTVSVSVPGSEIQPAVDAGVVLDGATEPVSFAVTVTGTNTTEATQTLHAGANMTLQVVSGVAQPLTQTVALPDSTWHVVHAGPLATFTNTATTVSVSVTLSGFGTVVANLTCTPTAPAFASLGSVQLSPTSLAFPSQRVGTFGDSKTATLINGTASPLTISNVSAGGANLFDFFGSTTCMNGNHARVLAAGAKCTVTAFFSPTGLGTRRATITLSTSQGAKSVALSGAGTEGYYIAGAHGEVGTFGDAVFQGDATHLHLSQPMISLATTPNGDGYWLLARDGGIFSYGNAAFYGSTGNIHLNKPVVAMSTSPGGRGYRLVASDGGIFAFGDARFYGSTGGIHLNKPIVGMASTVTGRGYWLVASDGGIFAFGDARFQGSLSGRALSAPIMQMTPTPSGRGYWLLGANGALYPFGDAHNYGTATGQQMAGMSATPDGKGYWEATRSGRIFNFGDAHSYGDVSNQGVNDVIGIAGTSPSLPPGIVAAGAALPRTHTLGARLLAP